MLGRTVGCFLPVEVCMVPLGAVKVSPWGTQVSSSLGVSGPYVCLLFLISKEVSGRIDN